MRTLTTTLLLVLLVYSAALADTVTADFENDVNLGGWTFNHYDEGINPVGGNPGGWYFENFEFTFAPIITCATGAEHFTGNFAQAGVSRISGDFKTDYCENGFANEFNFTLVITWDNGTPNFIDDDLFVYPDPANNLIPPIGEGWTHYDFDIPSGWTGGPGELPAGWKGGSGWTENDDFPADRTFEEVITNVTTVHFIWLDPNLWAIIVPWSAGADNITIEYDTVPVATEEATWGDLKALYR